MCRYTVLVTDLDGTLLDHHGQLPEANIQALRRCADQGITLVLATGRNLTITRPIAAAIDRGLFLILQDGCLLIHYPSLQVLAYYNLPRPLAQAVYDIFRAEKLSVMLFDPLPNGEHFILCENGPFSPGLAAYLQTKSGQYTCQDPAQLLTTPFSKIVTIDHQARINSVYQRLQTTLPDARILQTEAARLQAWFLEVGSAQASKLQALQRLLGQLKRDWSEVIAIGDAESDIEMIQAAGLGVAMGNASERVKAVADRVISSNAEAGLARFLELLIDGAFDNDSIPPDFTNPPGSIHPGEQVTGGILGVDR